jgi:hypothetical protein
VSDEGSSVPKSVVLSHAQHYYKHLTFSTDLIIEKITNFVIPVPIVLDGKVFRNISLLPVEKCVVE